MSVTKLLIADDHDLVRESISRMLSDIYGYEILADAKTGEDAIRLCREHNPDIVLMDVKMPGMGGLEATKSVLRVCQHTKVIALTGAANNVYAKQLMQAGASAYVTKEAGFDEIVAAIDAVKAGKKFVASAVAQQLVLEDASNNNDAPFDKLSERELQTAMQIIEGKKVIDIAQDFSVSPKTVNSYRYRIFEKLSISTDVELALLAVKHKLIDNDLVS